MSEENKNSILYSPEIEYEKNYDTSGQLTNEGNKTEEEDKDLLEKIHENINNIENILPILPNGMGNMLKPIITVINKVIPNDKIPDEPDKNKENIYVYPNGSDNKTPEYEYPPSFFRDEPDPFVIETTNKTKPEIIMNNYNYDLVSIIDDYLEKLYKDVMNYFNNIITMISGIEVANYEKLMGQYTISADKVSTNYKHLSDSIIRSQLSRQMKTRLYNKMFNLDKTIIQIKTCKVGVEQRIRYYQASYQDDSNIENIVSNRLLEKNRMDYDLKYKQNFTNLYKYLNSSEILFNECLCMSINEIQAKTILLEKEGLDLW